MIVQNSKFKAESITKTLNVSSTVNKAGIKSLASASGGRSSATKKDHSSFCICQKDTKAQSKLRLVYHWCSRFFVIILVLPHQFEITLPAKKKEMEDFLKELFNSQQYDEKNFFLIAGPCVVESEQLVMEVAEKVYGICKRLDIPYIFKASYRKANRTSAGSFTGLGDEAALQILKKVKNGFLLPTTTDIHAHEEAAVAAEYVDILQIPAFLCRQTDLLVAAAETGKIVNVKKGQFVNGDSMKFAVEKIKKASK